MRVQPRQHGPWKVTGSHRKYRSEELEVREDELLGPDGKRRAWATVKVRAGVTVLPVDDHHVVYLAKEFRYAVGRECIEAISGPVEQGETPAKAAQRELREELGIKADEWVELGRVDLMTSRIDSPSTLFLASGLSFVRKKNVASEKIRTVKMALSEAVGKALNGEITDGSSCVLLFRAYSWLLKHRRDQSAQRPLQ